MPPRHDSVEAYRAEIDAERAGIMAPRDGAVFYTNGARTEAEAYIAARNASGRPACTLEATAYGQRLDREGLWRDTPHNDAMDARHARAAGVDHEDRLAARDIFDHISRRYAEQASGRTEVFCRGQEPSAAGTFARVERDALLNNEKVTHVNGVRREDLQAIRDRGDLNAKRDMSRMIIEGDRMRDDPKREAKLETLRADIEKEANREVRRAKLEEERRSALAAADRRAAAQEAPAAASAQPKAQKADAPEAERREPDASSKAKVAAHPHFEATSTASPQSARESAVSAGRRRFNEKFDRSVGQGKEKDSRGKNLSGGG